MATKTADWRLGPTVCRCCLAEGCYKDISTEYFWMGKREVYAEMLSDTFDVSIAYSQSTGPNSNSRLICEPCISRLRDASDFKRQVLECEKTFMQHLDPGRDPVPDVEVPLDPPEKEEVKLERVKLEEKVSDDDFDPGDFGNDPDDDDDDLDDQPLTKLASKIPKKESVDLQDLLDTARPRPDKRKAATKAKASPSKKAKKKETPKATASKVVAKPIEKKKKGSESDSAKISSEKQPLRNKIVPLFQVDYDRTLCRPLGTITDFSKLQSKSSKKDRTRSFPRITFTPSRSASPVSAGKRSPTPPKLTVVLKPPTQVKVKTDTRQNALTLFEFSTVYPFVYGNNKFKCFICSRPFLETSLLRQHMSETHAFAQLKRLVNNRRENILKVDVNEILCKLCSNRLNTLIDLKIHLKAEHFKSIDPDLKDNIIPFNLDSGNGTYACVICHESFIKVRILVIHMSVHFNNYSCEICGTGFMTLRLLKKHLEVHENGNFPCDKCNKVFPTTHKRALHIRGVHMKQCCRRCPMCPEKFNSNYRRTIHLQDVHNQSTRVHRCETCGRGFNLKYHLLCHIRSVHLQERNHQCDVCHQRFCNKETLKRHMVIHSGEKNHKCEVCGMAFLRRKNLKDHLRLHDIVV